MSLNKQIIEPILAKESLNDLVHWIKLTRQAAIHHHQVFLNNPSFLKIYEKFEKKGLLTPTHSTFFKQHQILSETNGAIFSPEKSSIKFHRP